jgi:hypothetical protein
MEAMFTDSNESCFTKVIGTKGGLFNVIIFDGGSSDSWNGLDSVQAFILLNRVAMNWSLNRLQTELILN